MATFLSVFSCARLTDFLHPELRKTNAVLITLKPTTLTLRRARGAPAAALPMATECPNNFGTEVLVFWVILLWVRCAWTVGRLEFAVSTPPPRPPGRLCCLCSGVAHSHLLGVGCGLRDHP